MVFISVIICTYNRSRDLPKILDNLSSLKTDASFDHEIILVDNNSKDRTKEIIGSYVKQNPRFRYILEPEQGKSMALNTGINSAKGEILAFTDDDVIIDNAWLQNIAHFSKNHDFDAIGGKVLLFFPPGTPQWIIDHKDIVTGPVPYHDCGEAIKPYDSTMNAFVGANMVIKKKTIKEIGGFDFNIGPGTEIVLGEDHEYFYKLQKSNKKVFYDPNLVIYHPVEKGRTDLEFLAKWCVNYGKYLVVTDQEKKNFICYFGVPRHLFREVFSILFSLPFLMVPKHRFIKAWKGLFIKIGMMQAYRKKSLSM